MVDILTKEELINKINMLEIEIDSLKREINSYKENNKIKEKYKIGNEDVIDLKGTQNPFKEREATLRTILANSRDFICMVDLKTREYIYFGPSLEEMIGFTIEEYRNMSTEELFERVHPDERHLVINKSKLVDSGIEAFANIRYRWKAKNGKYRWFENSQNIIPDENGQPIAYVGIYRDITDQKAYEEKLDFQAKILSNVYDAIIVVDKNDRIKYCNKAFVKLFGWHEEELIGQEFFDFVQVGVDEISKEKISWTLKEKFKVPGKADESHLNEIICYSKDGKQIIVDINISVTRDSKGQLKKIILSIIDVSARYKYELELKKSEEKFRYLFNSIDEGLAIEDVIFDIENKPVDFRFVELNPAYEKHTGIKIKDILGKTAKEFGFIIDDFWYEICGKVALTGESIRIVHVVKALNKWLEAFVFRIDLEKNNRIGILFRDITDKILHSRKLEELVKIQDELYVNVSHELKTPLNVIYSANQVMDMYLKSDSIEDKRDKLCNYNNSIKQNCYRLTKLINNIVDLSKSNSGLLMLNLSNVNIVDVVENIVQSVSDYVKTKDLKITFDTNVEEKIIACDADKIERIMLNLISNAIKFSNPKGEILVKVTDKNKAVDISVKDTGRGIEKQNLEKIFKRFYQEDKSLTRNAEGTGIGLSLIKSLVELHGGNISVESEINNGSVFKVVLPAGTIESGVLIEKPDSLNNKIETIKIEFSDIYSI